MEDLNKLKKYTIIVQIENLLFTYKAILDFIGKLKAYFIKNYSNYDISNIYQGYLDRSYFSITTKQLKDKELKLSLV